MRHGLEAGRWNVRLWRRRGKLGPSQKLLAFETDLHCTVVGAVQRVVCIPSVIIVERLARAPEVKAHELLIR